MLGEDAQELLWLDLATSAEDLVLPRPWRGNLVAHLLRVKDAQLPCVRKDVTKKEHEVLTMIHVFEVAELVEKHSQLRASRNELRVWIALGGVHPDAKADGHKMPRLLSHLAVGQRLPEDQRLLHRNARLLRLAVVLGEEVIAQAEKPCDGRRNFCVQLMQRADYLVSVLQGHLLPSLVLHRAEGEVQGVECCVTLSLLLLLNRREKGLYACASHLRLLGLAHDGQAEPAILARWPWRPGAAGALPLLCHL
mmetsp:Transcript_106765/g.227988  ORF Transcript_106765/g.227988 Transcript_106765/m.227988 type:complete len:251 (+) Transcript_106765:846-1598(+)